VVVKYSASINYYSALNLTKLDVLDDFDTIKVAIAYKVDGEELSHYPADLDLLARAEVVYHEMPGWKKPTTNARTFYDLPKQARDYVEVANLPMSRYPVLIVFPVHREITNVYELTN
jgi:adenylosuccinate synthase